MGGAHEFDVGSHLLDLFHLNHDQLIDLFASTWSALVLTRGVESTCAYLWEPTGEDRRDVISTRENESKSRPGAGRVMGTRAHGDSSGTHLSA